MSNSTSTEPCETIAVEARGRAVVMALFMATAGGAQVMASFPASPSLLQFVWLAVTILATGAIALWGCDIGAARNAALMQLAPAHVQKNSPSSARPGWATPPRRCTREGLGGRHRAAPAIPYIGAPLGLRMIHWRSTCVSSSPLTEVSCRSTTDVYWRRRSSPTY